MCEPKPGARCAHDTHDEAISTVSGYNAAHPAGPVVNPLTAAEATMRHALTPGQAAAKFVGVPTQRRATAGEMLRAADVDSDTLITSVPAGDHLAAEPPAPPVAPADVVTPPPATAVAEERAVRALRRFERQADRVAESYSSTGPDPAEAQRRFDASVLDAKTAIRELNAARRRDAAYAEGIASGATDLPPAPPRTPFLTSVSRLLRGGSPLTPEQATAALASTRSAFIKENR